MVAICELPLLHWSKEQQREILFGARYLTEGKECILEEFAAFSHIFKMLKSALSFFPDYVGRPCL